MITPRASIHHESDVVANNFSPMTHPQNPHHVYSGQVTNRPRNCFLRRALSHTLDNFKHPHQAFRSLFAQLKIEKLMFVQIVQGCSIACLPATAPALTKKHFD